MKRHQRMVHTLIVIGVSLFLGFMFLAVNVGSEEYGPHISKTDHTVQTLASEVAPRSETFSFFNTITHLASPSALIIFSVIIAAILFFVQRRRLAALFIVLLMTTGLVSQMYKVLIARQRPADILSDVTYFGYAFPSGHALAATLFYGFLAFCIIHATRRWWIQVAIFCFAALLIVLIGLSRIFIGAHWFSDVIGGWLLGGSLLSFFIALFYITNRVVTDRERKRSIMKA